MTYYYSGGIYDIYSTSGTSYILTGQTTTANTIIGGQQWYNLPTDFWQEYRNLPARLNQEHEGMDLKDFLEMWEKDGFKIVEIETKELDEDRIAKRYNVYSDIPLDNGYGRHLGFIVVVDRVNKIIRHDIFNIAGGR